MAYYDVCARCGGRRYINLRDDYGRIYDSIPCPDCDGLGTVKVVERVITRSPRTVTVTCRRCNGTGQHEDEYQLFPDKAINGPRYVQCVTCLGVKKIKIYYPPITCEKCHGNGKIV